MGKLEKEKESRVVAIPLGQGQVFNENQQGIQRTFLVAIPLGQGQVFNSKVK